MGNRALSANRTWWVSSWAIGILLAIAQASAGQAIPDTKRVEATIRNVLWQALPDDVRAVYVGPDDRLWLEVGRQFGDANVEAAKKLIQQEFPKPMPQLWGVRPALFEPNGRVWFRVSYSQTLLGYDGRQFIERKSDEPLGFFGNCPGHGAVGRPTFNVQLGEVRFFPDQRGIHSFDGKSWSYQAMFQPKATYQNSITLSPSPDGQSLLALAAQHNSAAVWEWHGGKWTQLWAGPSDIRQAVPFDAGFLMRTGDGRLLRHLVEERIPLLLEALLKDLDAPEAAVRDGASWSLHNLGQRVAPWIDGILREGKSSPEVHARLQDIRQHLQPAAEPTAAFGPYLISGLRQLYADQNGLIVLAVDKLSKEGKALGPGLAIADGQRRFSALLGEEFIRDWKPYLAEDSGPLATGDRTIWLRSRRLDLSTGKVIDNLPDPKFAWLHAVQKSGRIFVSAREPTQPARPVMVYTPAAADDRRKLEPMVMEVADPPVFAIGSDGAVWAVSLQDELMRFDGQQWKSITRLPVSRTGQVRRVTGFVAGRGGEVLVDIQGDTGRVFVSGQTILRDMPLDQMIAANRKRFVSAFAVPNPWNRCHRWLSIVADKRGNIWLQDQRKLRVLVREKWLDGDEALRRAGAPRPEVEFLRGVGDGSRVYLNHFFMAPDAGGHAAFFGEVENGTVSLMPAPQSFDELAVLSVTAPDGALWLPALVATFRSRGPNSMGGSIQGQKTLRLTEKGIDQEIRDQGVPFLLDQGGNVWLGRVWRNRSNRFNILRDGKLSGSVEIAGVDEPTMFRGQPMSFWLLSDKPGSVWAWTSIGLAHYVADARNPAAFTCQATYSPLGLRGRAARVDYSPLGYVVVGTSEAGSGANMKHYVHLYRLP